MAETAGESSSPRAECLRLDCRELKELIEFGTEAMEGGGRTEGGASIVSWAIESHRDCSLSMV